MKDRRYREIIDKWDDGDEQRYLEKTNALHERVLLDSYGGDEKRSAAVDFYARFETVYWQDLVDAATILPEFEGAAQWLIIDYLGYLPFPRSSLEFEPFLRALIKRQRDGQLRYDEFVQQVEEQMRQLRYADMKEGRWLTACSGAHYDSEWYESYLLFYKNAARERVIYFLGYEPEVIYSWKAELWLRELIASDKKYLATERTRMDAQLMTIIQCCETYHKQGRAAADALPLLGDKATR